MQSNLINLSIGRRSRILTAKHHVFAIAIQVLLSLDLPGRSNRTFRS